MTLHAPMPRPARVLAALVVAACAACDHGGAPPSATPPSPHAAPSPVAVTPRTNAPPATAEPPPSAPPVDPGDFARFGCSTDAMPPHIATGRALVAWRPLAGAGGAAFSYRNLPARCGGAYPGQMVDGVRSRPGDGMEFVVCMPDERRLDIGILRRGPVPAGAVDVAHLENVVRLRIGLDRRVNVVSPAGASDAITRLTLGPRLRTASGAARLARTPSGAVEGIVEFQIDCSAAR